jgi:putative transposase
VGQSLPLFWMTTRREYLDHMLFFSERDLQSKLDQFQTHYNDVRAHSSLDMKTPKTMAFGEVSDEQVVSIEHYRWEKHCNGLYQLPVAA